MLLLLLALLMSLQVEQARRDRSLIREQVQARPTTNHEAQAMPRRSQASHLVTLNGQHHQEA